MKLHGLYAITPDLNDTDLLQARVEQALRGGARILQYRNKLAGPDLSRVQALALRALSREYAAIFIINDDVQLAIEVGADGVHLGGDDGDLAVARSELPQGMLLGASCYDDPALAQAAIAASVDYVAFGAVFQSGTKPLARRASPELIAKVRTQIDVPIVAIGGITPDNAPQVIAAGADCVAVIGALFDAEDIAKQAQLFSRCFT
jgi:thiamine-phosphate pyrophosphorylase